VITNSTVSRSLRGGAALRALILCGAGASAALFAAPAFAQETPAPAPASDQAAPAPQNDKAASGGDIVVTGTLLRNSATATAAPLTTLTSDDLAKRGINTVADAINSIAANNAGSMNKSWNSFNFATGATAVSLRGLTTGNTLTLFDGLRSAPYPLADDGHRNFVDLNTIPAGIIDRIEVLQDGASSTYGADAVAGVVNVIVKKEITGVHLDASAGISEFGDAGERRLSGTVGYGKLNEQGFNVYVNAEYQKNDPLYAHDRKFPYNGGDLSSVCNAPGSCLNNAVINGVQGDGTIAGIGSTRVPVVRPYDSATASATGNWRLLNPAAGCRDLKSITLTPAQQAALINPITGFGADAQQCQQDNIADYLEEQPMVERFGGTIRGTVNVGSRAQAYAMFNYYRTKTDSSIAPLTFAGQTAAGGTSFVINPFVLPVYVCAARVNCATDPTRTLNPNNPFAASGQEAQLNYRYDRPRITLSDARTYRASAGINGSFADDWRYAADFTWSEVDLKITNKNFLFAQHLLDVVNDGSFNFLDPSANSEAIRNYIAPTQVTNSKSNLWQAQATLSKDLFQLPGGALSAAVGVSYRKESITNPSANPANDANPSERYYSINAVGATGSRNVKSAFFEVEAPIVDMLSLNASGRYDDYSSGQKNFSPKVTAIFKPIKEIKLRGTFSKGFRIPSFNEAYGLPTTGYITHTVDNTVAGGAAFLAAHGNNAYASQPYSYGLTAIGNPSLKPEKSTAYTGGIVIQPTRNLSFTADYWHIKIKGLITNPDYSGVVDAYYSNNGVVNIPGLTVLPGLKDPDHPNALPLLGFIQYSFVNANSETASGLDFSGTARFPITAGITFTSRVDASYLIKLEKDIGGSVQRYDGTLSPCDITSCSGAPKWRGTWTNTLDFGQTSLTGTVNYTSGYDMASVDYGGVKGDCANNAGVSVVTYADGTPFKCRAKRFVTLDLTASTKIADHFTLYANALNILGAKPDFNPGQSYGLGYNYNVAWEGQGFTGRFFRVGAKVDF
jgi:iron complex outermembrane receptor protein